MSILDLLLFNILSYIVFYKLSFLISSKYLYPFRVADLINFFLNSIFFFSVAYLFFSLNIAFIILFINLNLFYIFYSIFNLINTSPRIKILIETYINKKILLKKLFKYYNYNIILNNRLKRLKSSNQIQVKDSLISLKKKNFSFFKLIVLIMNFLKKI